MWVPEFTNNITQTSLAVQRHKDVNIKLRRATSMLEILVVITIITMCAAVMMPSLRKARQQATAVQCMDNQRKIVIAVSAFASDNSGQYPESVATIGQLDENWNWQEPTMLTAYRPLSPKQHRSLSEYLYNYIRDTSVISCPSSPKKYKFLQQSWDAGDKWDNPETPSPQDPVLGTYCLYWDYIGFIEEGKEPFQGPKSVSGEPGRSKLLVSDYFGYGHWRNKFAYGDHKAYGSSERFKAAAVTPGTEVSSAFWSRHIDDPNISLGTLDIELHAAYADGHVECYSPPDVIKMKVSKTPDGSVPYPDDLGPGDFYLPLKALY